MVRKRPQVLGIDLNCSESRIAETMLLSRYAGATGWWLPLAPEVLEPVRCQLGVAHSVGCSCGRDICSRSETTRTCTHKSAFCKRGSVNVRFAPKATEVPRCREVTRCATSGPSAAQQNGRYSITSSAVASSDGGTARSSALAVLLLTTSSNLVGCCTGSSPGFAPLSTRST
jgi:hypothetical protein